MGLLCQPARALVAFVAIAVVLTTTACGGDKPSRVGASASATQSGSAPSQPVATKSAPVPAETSTATPAVGAIATPLSDGRQLILVPFQGFPLPILERLRDHFHTTYGIGVTVAPPLALTSESFDLERQQVVAERLLDLLVANVARARPDDVIVGMTQHDMMLEDTPRWRFGFALRSELGHVGVVSTARMDPSALGDQPDDELFFHRAVKMVAKHLGILYYGLDTSPDPSSVMYGNVLSVDDLDHMGERLPVP